jgi:hypothetical protein
MRKPRSLTTIWASTACYRDSFTFYYDVKRFHPQREYKGSTNAVQRVLHLATADVVGDNSNKENKTVLENASQGWGKWRRASELRTSPRIKAYFSLGHEQKWGHSTSVVFTHLTLKKNTARLFLRYIVLHLLIMDTLLLWAMAPEGMCLPSRCLAMGIHIWL